MSNLFLKPATLVVDGESVPAKVRDPETMIPLAIEGEWKHASPFWTRRLRDGDVIDETALISALDDEPESVPQANDPLAD